MTTKVKIEKIHDLLIIGAGPSGIYAAFYAKLRNLSIYIVEKNQFPGGQPDVYKRQVQDFTNYSKNLMNLSQNKEANRIVTRQLLANAADLEIDNIGRILIPSNLLDEANLKSEIVLIGLGEKIEIWDAKLYREFKEKTDSTYTKLAESIEDEKRGI